jgi:hypothetical protein
MKAAPGGRHHAPGDRGLGAGDRGVAPGGQALGRRHAREGGYFLLDVLAAIIIISIGFAAFLGGLSIAAGITTKQNARVASLIEERNTHAKERTVFFQGK